MVQGKDQIIDGLPQMREPIVQEKLREEIYQKPGDIYYKQEIVKPIVNKQHLMVNFNEPAPVFRTNKKIVEDEVNSTNSYQYQHNLDIPVEDQRLVATPAKIGYKIPVNHYQYVPIFSQGCVPCCGCVPPQDDTIDPIQQQQWNEVIAKFS